MFSLVDKYGFNVLLCFLLLLLGNKIPDFATCSTFIKVLHGNKDDSEVKENANKCFS